MLWYETSSPRHIVPDIGYEMLSSSMLWYQTRPRHSPHACIKCKAHSFYMSPSLVSFALYQVQGALLLHVSFALYQVQGGHNVAPHTSLAHISPHYIFVCMHLFIHIPLHTYIEGKKERAESKCEGTKLQRARSSTLRCARSHRDPSERAQRHTATAHRRFADEAKTCTESSTQTCIVVHRKLYTDMHCRAQKATSWQASRKDKATSR